MGCGAAGYASVTIEAKRKGESAWLPEVLLRLAAAEPEALMVLDLGSRPDAMLAGVPTLLIDHHRPGGVPPDAELITGYGSEEQGWGATPTTGLLVFWCLRGTCPEPKREAMLWLAALSILSDLGDKAPLRGAVGGAQAVPDVRNARGSDAAERAAADGFGRCLRCFVAAAEG